jgi:hypothetical protein
MAMAKYSQQVWGRGLAPRCPRDRGARARDAAHAPVTPAAEQAACALAARLRLAAGVITLRSRLGAVRLPSHGIGIAGPPASPRPTCPPPRPFTFSPPPPPPPGPLPAPAAHRAEGAGNPGVHPQQLPAHQDRGAGAGRPAAAAQADGRPQESRAGVDPSQNRGTDHRPAGRAAQVRCSQTGGQLGGPAGGGCLPPRPAAPRRVRGLGGVAAPHRTARHPRRAAADARAAPLRAWQAAEAAEEALLREEQVKEQLCEELNTLVQQSVQVSGGAGRCCPAGCVCGLACCRVADSAAGCPRTGAAAAGCVGAGWA